MKYERKGSAFLVEKGLNIPVNGGFVLPFNDHNSHTPIAQRCGMTTMTMLSNV